MPGNGLTLSVGVGGQIKMIGLLDRFSDVFDVLLDLGSTSQSISKSESGRTIHPWRVDLEYDRRRWPAQCNCCQILVNRFRLGDSTTTTSVMINSSLVYTSPIIATSLLDE